MQAKSMATATLRMPISLLVVLAALVFHVSQALRKEIEVSDLGEEETEDMFEEEFGVPKMEDTRLKLMRAKMQVMNRSTSFMEQLAPQGLRFPMNTMDHFVAADPPPKWLGGGSFGQAYLVWDYVRQREDVVKFFYKNFGTATRPDVRWVTLADIKSDPKMKDLINEVERECKLSQHLNSETTNAGYTGKGHYRIMDCFGNNFGSARPNDPLFLVLENGGSDMRSFVEGHIKSGTLTIQMILELFKQLLEALDYLQSFSAPFMHHDLKPDNVVVKTHFDVDQKESYSVHLIDLGAMVHAKESKDACDVTAITPGYAGAEWRARTRVDSGLRCTQQNYDPAYPRQFDMFAAGSILLELITGEWLPEVLQAVTQARRWPHKVMKRGVFNYDVVKELVKGDILSEISNIYSKDRRVPLNVKKNLLALAAPQHREERQFIDYTLKYCLSIWPKGRPVASDLLRIAVMQRIETYEDPMHKKETQPPIKADTEKDKEYWILSKKCKKVVEAFKAKKLRYMPDGRLSCTSSLRVLRLQRIEVDMMEATFKCLDKLYTDNLDCGASQWKVASN